ncbi:hypothetical protein [Aridibaculum aurantiacum]|uniref:hypothetical protein n=1 Tax=Aridibaculum aurantiacum TaxID=2810307 RepID=UPI001A95D935|nr:hypothetical protein [Aridibaculum aurantiacum]
MAILRSPVFIICLVLFIIHQVMQKGMNMHHPFMDSYLDNLVAMPVILTLLLAERQWLFKKGNTYRLPALDIALATLYIILITEILFPLFSEKFTGDWVDAICYALGSLLFYFTINKISSTTRTTSSEHT